MIQCLTPLVSSSSCSSIRCTSSSAASSCGASFGPISATLACSRCSSSATALRAGAHAVDLGLDLLRLDEVVRHVDAARHHEHGAPDGDATGDGEPWTAKVMAHSGRAAARIEGEPVTISRLPRTCRSSSASDGVHAPPAPARRLVSTSTVAADAGGQHHHAHDALGIDAAVAAREPDLAGIAARELGELGRGARMQAQLIADGHGCLDHCAFFLPGSAAPPPPPASRPRCRR